MLKLIVISNQQPREKIEGKNAGQIGGKRRDGDREVSPGSLAKPWGEGKLARGTLS